MDAANIYRHGLGSALPRQPQYPYYFPGRPAVPAPYPWHSPDNEQEAPHRIAHTLTACCRCRQRKTRCDPALPRCLPCERSGSICEYYDSTKGKKINRSYVVNLQKRVRELEAELSQYTDEEGDYQNNHDDMVRPGGMVRLDQTDETPRYLGPSSGIAMTRLLMEEAKRYTESRRIADLIPGVRARRIDRRDRMQSVTMARSISGPSGRNKSYPAHSDFPTPKLPERRVVDGFVRIFNEKVQVFTPILHEKLFLEDLDAVFAGDPDPYKNFVVDMVVAIGLQKMGGYAGLPDGYYLRAMKHFEDVIRPKDLKTLQCLILIGQYSLLAPTRTAIYYVIGLAVKICQQMGLGDERTIALGVTDPQTLDMRRRLSWIVTTQELGLAHTMGRPNGFSKGDDLMNVKFFEPVVDEDITPEGIRSGRPCVRKMVAIYFCKMRLLQAEIRRVLYEKSRPEPAHETHPWFAEMEQKLRDWLDACPEQPAWCKPWFTGRYHNMIISLYRPSPQVPRPTGNAAIRCFEGSRYIINLTARQIEQGAVDVTWVFLLTIYASLNALLWSISYPEVRAVHTREEVQDLAATALETVTGCSERWPGSSSAVELYTVIADACLQSYDMKDETPSPVSSGQLDTPVSFADPTSPESDTSRATSSRQPLPQAATSLFNTSPFGYVFDGPPELLSTQYGFDNGPPSFQHQPAFRSNSIFGSPSTDSNGRRFSHLAPDSTHSSDIPGPERMGHTPPPPMSMLKQELKPPTAATPMTSLPSPPESLAPRSTHPNNASLSPRPATTPSQTTTPILTPLLYPATPGSADSDTTVKQEHLTSPQPQHFKQHHQQQQQQHPVILQPSRPATFTIPHPAQPPPSHTHLHPNSHQRPLPPPPTTVTDWFSPPPPLISPHTFSNNMGVPTLWDGAPNPFSGLGLSGHEGGYAFGHGPPRSIPMDMETGGGGGGNGEGNWNFGGWGTAGGQGGEGFGAVPGPGGVGLPGQFQHHHNMFANTMRQGSLSQEQQMELMDVLEAEGMNDIDSFLSMGMGLDGGPVGGGGGNDGGVWG